MWLIHFFSISKNIYKIGPNSSFLEIFQALIHYSCPKQHFITWFIIPADGNVAGLSQLTQLLDKYKMEDISVKAADTKRKFSFIPELNSCQKLKEDESDGTHNIHAVFEWIGTVSCDSNMWASLRISSLFCPFDFCVNYLNILWKVIYKFKEE